MYSYKHKIDCYQDNRTFLSRSFSSKNDFLKQYDKSYNDKEKSKQLYLQILCELKIAICEGSIENFKKINKILNYMVNIENEEFSNCFNEEIYPLKNTNEIILACEYNQLEILKTIFSNYSSTYERLHKNENRNMLPSDEDENSHNAFYYSIRSGNTELLETLISRWPGKYFESRSTLLDEILSKTYQELKLKNVLLLNSMEFFVEEKLINLRFFSTSPKESQNNKISLDNINQRIDLVIEQINSLNSINEVNEEFLLVLKYITINIFTLKRQLKSSYDTLPWEEVEFSLICFTSCNTTDEEINIFFRVVLTRVKILNHLNNFAKRLAEVQSLIIKCSISWLFTLPNMSRKQAVAQILEKYPEFKELYQDYYKIRDIHTLNLINDYVTLISSIDANKKEGKLAIIRSLQAIGECLKNTLESPKLSTHTCDLLFLSLPQSTRKLVVNLRNSLSHSYSLTKRTEILQNEKVDFFNGIKNDIKKIGIITKNICFEKNLKTIKKLLEDIVSCKDVDELKQIISVGSTLNLKSLAKFLGSGENHISEHEKFNQIIGKLKSIIRDQTGFEKLTLQKMEEIVASQNIQRRNKFENYILLVAHLSSIKSTTNTLSMDNNSLRVYKYSSQKALNRLNSSLVQPKELNSLSKLSLQLLKSCDLKKNSDKQQEIGKLILEIFCIIDIQYDNIHWVSKLSDKLMERTDSNDKRDVNFTSVSTKGKSINHLNLKLLELKTIITEYGLNKSLTDSICENNKQVLTALEMMILEILSVLGDALKRLEDNLFFLDDNIPLLIGKNFRNHLAHGNAILDIVSSNSLATLIVTANKLVEEIDKNHSNIGKIVIEDFEKLKKKIDLEKNIIFINRKMFEGIELGDFDSLRKCISQGADVHARKNNMWTTLHAAAKGNNLDVVKFLIEQKVDIQVQSTDGKCPLHVAAEFGSASIVEFFLNKKYYDVNCKDYMLKNPLHLAALNNHKVTVELLLKYNANYSAKDSPGYAPLHYAVRENHIEVTQTLLKKEKTVDANEMKGGFTALHAASENGCIELVRFLLNRGANVHAKTDGMTIPLHLASLNGHTEVVKLLVAKKSIVNASVCDGCTALHYAIENGHKEIVDILLSNGANPNVFDKAYGNTPLHYAAKFGHVDIAQALIHHKANVNAFDVNKKTPLFNAITNGHLKIVEMLCQQKNTIKNVQFALHLACLYGSAKIVDYLINLPMDINARDYNGNTPLHLASYQGHTDIVVLLVKNKANINVKNADGFTPLLVAAVGSLDNGSTNDEKIPSLIQEILQKSNLYTDYKKFDRFKPRDIINNEKVKIVDILLQNGAAVDVRTSNGLTALHLAVGGNNHLIIELLISRNIAVNSTNKYDNTPLQMAAMFGSKEAVNILIKNGANVNYLSKGGLTALHWACISGSCDIVKILLTNNADINAKSDNNFTPLSLAVKGNHPDTVKVLIAHKSQVIKIDEKVLTLALESNNNDILKMLLNCGTVNNCDIKTIINGALLLHKAIINCSEEIISTLISNGADVHLKNEETLTALHMAVLRKREKLIKILLEKGADVNCKTDNGTTVLHIAVTNGDSEIVEILLQYDIDVNARDDKDHTALETAVADGHSSIVKMLFPLTKMCDNNIRNKHFTILHTAAQLNDHLEIIKYLIKNGIDINSTNEMGTKPIHIAAREGHEETVKYFLSLGQDIDELGVSNKTPLHYCAIYNKVKVAQYLINNGANVNARSLLNRTPLHSAVEEGSKLHFIELLLKHGAMYNALDNFGLKPISLSKDTVITKLLTSIDQLWQAVKNNNIEEVKSCIKKMKATGAIVNAKNSDNVTPLHYAAWKGYDDIAEELLRVSNDIVNVIGKKGLTPLHYAAKFGHLNVCKTLLAAGAIYSVEEENGKTPIDLSESKDVNNLLHLIGSCFEMVSNKNSKAIISIKKVKDVTVVKALMNACNREGKSLITAAILNNYSKIEELKLILQDDLVEQIKLAYAMKVYERYDEALKIYELVLQRRTELFGKNNPGTLDIQENIAGILYKQQKYQVALEAFQNIYEKQKDLLGENSKDALNTRSTIALVLHRQGKNEEALEIFQQVYDKQKSILTLNDHSFINTHLHMALVLNALLKFDEALKLNNKVFEHQKRRLGSNHPETLISQNNIAMVLTNQGNYDEAETLYRKVYESRKKYLGPTHSDTLRAFHNIVTILDRQKKYDEAMKAYEEVLKIQKSHLGSDHIDTLNTQLNMADMLYGQGKHVSAFKIFNFCLPEFKKKVGPNHFQVYLYEKKMEAIKKLLNFTGQSDLIDIINNLNVEARVAVSSGDLKSLEKTLECDIDVNDADEEGRTLLHFAASNGNVDITRALLNSGCILNIPSKKGNTPLHTAVSKGHVEIVAEFLKHMSRAELSKFVDAKTTVSGTTALHIAAKDGNYEIVLMLLKCGVVYSPKNNEGKTPLNLSREKRIVDLLELIDSCFKDVMKGNAEVKHKLSGIAKDEFLAVVNARNDLCMSLAQVAVVNKFQEIGKDILTAMKKASENDV